jgi:predicted AAA+ superfamily ATPase
MYGTLPFALQYTNPSQVYEAISGLLDKIIQKDIESLKSFDPQTLHAIRRVLFLLAEAQDVLSARKLLSLVELDSTVTVQRILQVLEQAEVLIRVMPYGSQKGKVTKPSKYLFMSPAIRMALLGLVGKEATYHTRLGLLMEDATVLQLHREFMGSGKGNLVYEPAKGNADFILQIANQRQLAIEVGIGKKDSSQIQATMEERKCEYGLLISEGSLGCQEEKNILYVPLQFFLLS